ncbi:Gfo/Idh/MocA family protein [Clostridium sp.]|uniref:Gfo/Idh/MocA family protein n=1 Tax=Clostridium sp. TaxID=1506 RepID=UPI003A5BFD36
MKKQENSLGPIQIIWQKLKNKGVDKMLKFGIVGASKGAFISDVHIRGIEATHRAKLVAGCFSRHLEKNAEAAEYRGVSSERTYATAFEMAEAEGKREDGIDFVVITTPNVFHYEIAKAFLNAGINVSSDKPVTTDESQALELQKLAKEKGLKFCVTFTYAGYPALQHAREIIKRGDLGDIVMIMGEYVQDWLAGNTGMPPWRTDPKLVGKMNSLADIGSHVAFTVNYLTGLEMSEACCELDNVGGYKTDTNSSVLLKYNNGATGIIWASQIAHGNDNGIRIRIYGTKGSIEWRNEEAEVFNMTLEGYPTMLISKGRQYKMPYSSSGRLPAGHHEGLYYAFANIYEEFLKDLEGEKAGYYPNIQDGVRIMHWLDSCWDSNKKHSWVKL